MPGTCVLWLSDWLGWEMHRNGMLRRMNYVTTSLQLHLWGSMSTTPPLSCPALRSRPSIKRAYLDPKHRMNTGLAGMFTGSHWITLVHYIMLSLENIPEDYTNAIKNVNSSGEDAVMIWNGGRLACGIPILAILCNYKRHICVCIWYSNSNKICCCDGMFIQPASRGGAAHTAHFFGS